MEKHHSLNPYNKAEVDLTESQRQAHNNKLVKLFSERVSQNSSHLCPQKAAWFIFNGKLLDSTLHAYTWNNEALLQQPRVSKLNNERLN